MAEGMTRKEQAARVRWVADTIALNEPLYDQGSYRTRLPSCETAGCVAGFAVWLLGTKVQSKGYESGELRIAKVRPLAVGLLGLTTEEASELFNAHWASPWVEADDGMEPSAQEAAHRLRYFARTGSIHK